MKYMVDLEATIDTSKFDAAFAEYLKDTTKSLQEAVNTKSLFIDIGWINEIPSPDKEKISSDLMEGSKIAPDAPIAAILVNKQRKAKGKRGLNGAKMSDAVGRFIRVRQSHRNRVRSGCLPAKRILSAYVDSKRGAPRQVAGVKQKGSDMGYAIPAKGSSWVPEAIISNQVEGTAGSEQHVQSLKMAALQRAINNEADNTEQHVLEKRLKENADKFNNS